MEKDEDSLRFKKKKPIPHDFVLDLLAAAEPVTKPMFGCTAVYVENKIVLILREKPTEIFDNGVWLATTSEHHESLQKIFPSMRSIAIFGAEKSSWQILPSDSQDFEASVTLACELVLKRDPRIGKIPKKKNLKRARR